MYDNIKTLEYIYNNYPEEIVLNNNVICALFNNMSIKCLEFLHIKGFISKGLRVMNSNDISIYTGTIKCCTLVDMNLKLS